MKKTTGKTFSTEDKSVAKAAGRTLAALVDTLEASDVQSAEFDITGADGNGYNILIRKLGSEQ